MEYIYAILDALFPDETSVLWFQTAMYATLFFVVGLGVTLFIAGMFDPRKKRLNELGFIGHSNQGEAYSEKIADKLENVSNYILPKSEKESSKIQAKLIQAGYRSENAVLLFYGLKTALAVCLPIIAGFGASMFPQISMTMVVYLSIVMMAIGLFGPNYIVSRVVQKRQLEIRRSFPEALDLMVVCVEAGLSFELAFKRIGDELRGTRPILAEEFAIINGELRAGIARTEALKNFAFRTGVDEVKGFVALLSQSMRFGTSVAKTLRIYSEDFRDRRMQAAEEKAAKVGTKLIFPLIFCFFPSIFIVTVGPPVLKALEVFGR